MTSTPKIRNGIQQFAIDMRTTSYNKNYNDLLRGGGEIKYWLSYVFKHFHFHNSHVSFHCTLCRVDIKRISLGFSGMHLAKLKVSNECLSLRKQKQTLSFKKIMYFLLCTMKLKNRMHWKWQTKTLNAKRAAFFR